VASRRADRATVALVGVLLVAAAVAGLVVHLRSRDRVDRIAAMVHWPASCARISKTSPGLSPQARHWKRATQTVSVFCEVLGPGFIYARFADQADLRADGLAFPPAAATCLLGSHEVLIDALDPGEFPKLCRGLHGVDIDATRSLPAVACRDCDTPGGAERAADRNWRRKSIAQHRALARYWRTHATD
jgi:hypothetical protein